MKKNNLFLIFVFIISLLFLSYSFASNSIIGDYDDEYLGEGPAVFTGGTNIKELYLISGDKKTRTYFRWNVKKDLNAPTESICIVNESNKIIGEGCIGTIEFLKLEGVDWGKDHQKLGGKYDGVIDTWLYDKEFTGGTEIVAGTGSSDPWQELFSDDIHVSEFKVYAYPNIDNKLAWKNDSPGVNIAPYIRLQYTIKPSWKSRKKIGGEGKEIKFSTTIALSDIYSK